MLHPAPRPRSYPEVCLRLQEALAEHVTCYRMAHAEEEGSGEAPAAPLAQPPPPPQDAAIAPTDVAPTGGAQPHPLGHIVFLYKLVEGIAPASYGLNVARMAQLPDEVLQRAAAEAARAQAASEARRRRALAPAEQHQRQHGSIQLVQLAAECQQFLRGALAGGQVDVEAGRRLQHRARELLARQGGTGGSV